MSTAALLQGLTLLSFKVADRFSKYFLSCFNLRLLHHKVVFGYLSVNAKIQQLFLLSDSQ